MRAHGGTTGREGFVGFFLKCVSATINKEIIKRSPRGKEARAFLLEHSQISDIVVARFKNICLRSCRTQPQAPFCCPMCRVKSISQNEEC